MICTSIYSVHINEPYLKISLEKELLHRHSVLSSLKKSNYPINGLGLFPLVSE